MPDPSYLFGPSRARRPNVMARRHVVVSGHYYASLAGLQILEAGGNAIDAGVATGLAIDVLESEFVGFGGVAPVMIHLGERGETHVISGVGVWPKAADIEHFHRNFGGRIPEACCTPWSPPRPSIWIAALARFGTMSFGEVAAAAIRFAREGFPTYPFLAEQLAAQAGRDSRAGRPRRPSSCRTDGRPRWARSSCRPISRRTLQYMADQERAHAAGRPARRPEGGARCVLSRRHRRRDRAPSAGERRLADAEDDLAEFHSPIEPPCRIRFGEFDVYGCGAWSQGPMVLEALNILEGLDLRGMGHNSRRLYPRGDRGAEARRRGSRGLFRRPGVRRRAAGCAAVGRLCRAAARADRSGEGVARHAAGRARSAAWPSRPGVPIRRRVRRWRSPTARPETSFLCVADRHGNVFAATPSDPTIGGPVVPGTGITVVDVGVARLYRAGSSGARRSRTAAAHVGQSGDRHQAGRAGDAVRIAGQRGARPGDGAGVPQPGGVRHGPAIGLRGAALRQLLVA